MLKLLHEILKGNELTISLTRVTAKGTLAVVLAFVFAVMIFLYLAL
jgi:hypothetical protein